MNSILRFFGIRRKKVIFFLFQIQDLDMLQPVARAMKSSGVDVEAWLHPFVLKNSPRTRLALENDEIKWLALPVSKIKRGLLLFRASGVVTAADTTAKSHLPSFKLVKLANVLGLQTYTFQHGLENIGLTYYDQEFPPEQVDFASNTIFTWCETSRLDSRVPQSIVTRCIPTGCPKDYALDSIPQINVPEDWKNVVVVFENLHWGRYNDDYRQRFVADLITAAKACPDVTIVVKPHHAGQWLTKSYKGQLPKLGNLVVADPKDPRWEPYTAPALIKVAKGIITTPSTTAFDSVVMEKAVAVIGYDLTLPVYEPLPILQGAEDWIEFIRAVSRPAFASTLNEKAKQFRERASIPKNSAQNVAAHISAEIRGI